MSERHSQFTRALKDLVLGNPLELFEAVGSTNDVLKQKAGKGIPEGYTIVANCQTQGRGRMGRKWLSLAGKGIYMSVLLRPTWPASDAGLISLMTAQAVAKALKAFRLRSVQLKWPNDVLVRGKKIAGILVEPRIVSGRIEFAVVGIGINMAHQKADLAGIRGGMATSFRLEHNPAAQDEVIIRVIKELECLYQAMQKGNRNKIYEGWTAHRE